MELDIGFISLPFFVFLQKKNQGRVEIDFHLPRSRCVCVYSVLWKWEPRENCGVARSLGLTTQSSFSGRTLHGYSGVNGKTRQVILDPPPPLRKRSVLKRDQQLKAPFLVYRPPNFPGLVGQVNNTHPQTTPPTKK